MCVMIYTPAGPFGASPRVGAKIDCTPEIGTSEIIVDFQWHFPTEFHSSVVFSKGWSLSQWMLTEIVHIYIYIYIYYKHVNI